MARRIMGAGMKKGLKIAGAVAGAGLLAYGAYKGVKALKNRSASSSGKSKKSTIAKLRRQIQKTELKVKLVNSRRKLARAENRV